MIKFPIRILACLLLNIGANAQSLQWAKNFADPRSGGNDEASDVITDAQGNVYVTGYGTGLNLTDYITLKYSPSGLLLWAAEEDGISKLDDKASAIALDGQGNVYVTGYTAISSSNSDFLTIKYDSNGVKQWQVTYNGTANQQDYAIDLKVDSTGVYVAGNGYQNGTSTSMDYELVKYSLSGQQQWVKTYNVRAETLTGMALDKNSNVYITGYESGSGDANYLTLKYDRNGNQKWVKSFTSSGLYPDYSHAICVDNAGNVYVTGATQNPGSVDFATVKYDSTGTQKWVAFYDNTAKFIDRAYTITTDNLGNVYVGGNSFVPTTTDCIILKYDSAGTQLWTNTYSPTGKSGYSDVNTGLSLDKNNDVFMVGYSYVNSTTDNVYIIKYDGITGSQLWAKQYNGAGNSYDEGNAVSVDANGNALVVGISFGKFNLGEFATLKYDPAGNLVWGKMYTENGVQSDFALEAVVDPGGNIYVPASLTNTATMMRYNSKGQELWADLLILNGNSVSTPLNAVLCGDGVVYGANFTFNNKAEIHLVKYDSTGVIKWNSKYLSSTLNSFGWCVSGDGSGNFYLGGHTGSSYMDFLLIKYDKLGNQKWVQTYDVAGKNDLIREVQTDKYGNVYVQGNSDNANLKDNAVIMKYDSNGTQLWKYIYNTNSTTTKYHHMKVDANGNVVLITNYLNNGIVTEAIILKLDPSGAKMWESKYVNLTNNANDYLGVDSLGNAYVFSQTWNPGGTKYPYMVKYNSSGAKLWDVPVSSAGIAIVDLIVDRWGMPYLFGRTSVDAFIEKYDPMGTLQWQKLYNGKLSGQDRFDRIMVANNADIIATGAEQFSSSGNGNMHLLIAKYSNLNTTVGIWDPNAGNLRGKVSVYPNPATSEVNFDISESMKYEKLEVFDISARRVLEGELNSSHFTLNCETLRSGLYFYRLTGKEVGPVSGKFAIE